MGFFVRPPGSFGDGRKSYTEESGHPVAHSRLTDTMRGDPLGYLATELETLKREGLYRKLRVLGSEQAADAVVDGRQVVNLSSNNYLGLATHPRLRERALEAIRRYGVGAGSVRPIAGTMELHMELEQ